MQNILQVFGQDKQHNMKCLSLLSYLSLVLSLPRREDNELWKIISPDLELWEWKCDMLELYVNEGLSNCDILAENNFCNRKDVLGKTSPEDHT